MTEARRNRRSPPPCFGSTQKPIHVGVNSNHHQKKNSMYPRILPDGSWWVPDGGWVGYWLGWVPSGRFVRGCLYTPWQIQTYSDTDSLFSLSVESTLHWIGGSATKSSRFFQTPPHISNFLPNTPFEKKKFSPWVPALGSFLNLHHYLGFIGIFLGGVMGFFPKERRFRRASAIIGLRRK